MQSVVIVFTLWIKLQTEWRRERLQINARKTTFNVTREMYVALMKSEQSSHARRTIYTSKRRSILIDRNEQQWVILL